MSDTVFVEENVRHQLDSGRSEGIGVLVGRVSLLFTCCYIPVFSDHLQLTSKESFVLHFVPTPPLEESPEDYGTVVVFCMIFIYNCPCVLDG